MEKYTGLCLLNTATIIVFLHLLPVEIALETLLITYGCICPSQNYTCAVRLGSELALITSTSSRDDLKFSVSDRVEEKYVEEGGLQVFFSLENGVFNSSLHIYDFHLNGTNLSCEGTLIDGVSVVKNLQTTIICVIGPSSAPRDLSVVWDDPYAVVSFQSPVYGGECVEYYVVTAVSEEEERNISCKAKRDCDRYSCSISLKGSIDNYNFTVYGVTIVNNTFMFIGGSITECYLTFPEACTVIATNCGIANTLSISWKVSHTNVFISWRSVKSSGPTNYERADSEDQHLLTLDYSETGPVEIAVIFSSPACNKTSIITYNVDRILKNVSLKFPILVIESVDCIASPENYRIVVTSTDSTQLVNVSFNSTIEQDVGDVVRPNTQYTIRVQLVHISSNTVVDVINETILYSSPILSPHEPGNCNITLVAVVCIIGGLLLGLCVGAVVATLVTVTIMRSKRKRESGTTASILYETVGVVRGDTGPDTSENVAYAATTTPSTQPNPAYEPCAS